MIPETRADFIIRKRALQNLLTPSRNIRRSVMITARQISALKPLGSGVFFGFRAMAIILSLSDDVKLEDDNAVEKEELIDVNT